MEILMKMLAFLTFFTIGLAMGNTSFPTHWQSAERFEDGNGVWTCSVCREVDQRTGREKQNYGCPYFRLEVEENQSCRCAYFEGKLKGERGCVARRWEE